MYIVAVFLYPSVRIERPFCDSMQTGQLDIATPLSGLFVYIELERALCLYSGARTARVAAIYVYIQVGSITLTHSCSLTCNSSVKQSRAYAKLPFVGSVYPYVVAVVAEWGKGKKVSLYMRCRYWYALIGANCMKTE